MIHLGKDGKTIIVHCDTEKADSPTGHCRCTTDIEMGGLALPEPAARVHLLEELHKQGWVRLVAIEEDGPKAYDICPCDLANIEEAWAGNPFTFSN